MAAWLLASGADLGGVADVDAVKQLGIFWAAVNEPPPQTGIIETSIQSDEVVSPGKEMVKNEAPAPHLALGR